MWHSYYPCIAIFANAKAKRAKYILDKNSSGTCISTIAIFAVGTFTVIFYILQFLKAERQKQIYRIGLT